MAEVPLRYYIRGYRDFVMSGNFDHLDASNAASCFLNLVTRKLEDRPLYRFGHARTASWGGVAHHQAEFDTKESIYGNFSEKFERIQKLYAENSIPCHRIEAYLSAEIFGAISANVLKN